MFDPNDDPILEPSPGDGDKYPNPDARCASCGDAIPLGPVVCRACLEAGYCSACGLAHKPTACPDVTRARLDMERAERLMHRQIVADAARAIRERYEAHPIWQDAA